MWIIVGLGNPGAAYARSRHNIGFNVVDALADRWQIALDSHGAVRVGRGHLAGQPAMLVEPQTYMNRSGEALEAIGPIGEDPVAVIYDDLDLPVGQLRIRPRGSSGGHRGVASIAERIGEEFVRVRVGIGRPPSGLAAVDHVLTPPAVEEESVLHAAVERACDAVECLLADGSEVAMNRFNAAPPPAVP